MKSAIRPEVMWGLGLSEEETVRIREATGPGFFLRNFKPTSLPRKKEMGSSQKPSTAWIPWRVWSAIPENRREAYRELESTQRILIQDERDEPVEIEDVLEQGFLTVVRSPLTRAKVQDALFRAKEVSSLYADIYRMTEEVFLERELLARKTDQLLFLNKVLTGATASLDPEAILHNARNDLRMLLPVRLLHAAFWQVPQGSPGAVAEVFLSCRMEQSVETQWVDFLMDAVSRQAGPVESFEVRYCATAKGFEGGMSPESGQVTVLPLKAGDSGYGCLVLLCEKGARLGKDQVQTLHAAVAHLGLALRNALMFREVKTRADHDGLTRIHNRRSFDERMVQEMRRHQRYKQELSLLMIDVDHFKQVNDTYGHLAGDEVLRRMAEMLQEGLRATDFVARYGGEEFVIILPHTAEPDAWTLAERIRQRIGQAVFSHEGREFRVTASIGVASLSAGSLQQEQELILEADEALYKAKRNGRNMVVVSGKERRARRARSVGQ